MTCDVYKIGAVGSKKKGNLEIMQCHLVKTIHRSRHVYDERTSLDFINRHHQLSFFTLNQNQYLSDIIDDLYWKKEHYEFYTIYSDDCLRD